VEEARPVNWGEAEDLKTVLGARSCGDFARARTMGSGRIWPRSDVEWAKPRALVLVLVKVFVRASQQCGTRDVERSAFWKGRSL